MPDLLTTSATVFACLSKVCAPPPAGRGGSLPSAGGRVPAHKVKGGKLKVAGNSTDAVFGNVQRGSMSVASSTKVEANTAVASRLAKDPEFSEWVSKNIDRAAGEFHLSQYVRLTSTIGIPLSTALALVVRRRDPYATPDNAHTIATVREVAEVMREAYRDPSMSDSEAIARLLVRPIINSWARSASSEYSVISQLAAAKVHGTSTAAYKKFLDKDYRTNIEAQIKSGLFGSPMLHEAVVRAEYAATQAWFKERGIKTLTVYRGMEDANAIGGAGLKVGDVVKLSSNPLSSWATDPDEASKFALSKGLVIAMEVPVEAVQAIPFTGRGCLSETEVVLIGKPATAVVEYVSSSD